MLIGYGGGTDNSLDIVKKFPRVIIVDQDKKYKGHLYGSQGISIAELMSMVETEWFIYLHADVYLPDDWYTTMEKYQNEYDWFECSRDINVLIQFKHLVDDTTRAYSGSQMGRFKAFKNILPKIEDGYIQNNEDLIFQELIIAEGYKYGRVLETKHYHQVMNKRGEKEPKYKGIIIQRERTEEWKRKIYNVQARGIIKYCPPKPHLIRAVNESLSILFQQGDLNIVEFLAWVKSTNLQWLMHINLKNLRKKGILKRILIKIKDLLNPLIKKIFD